MTDPASNNVSIQTSTVQIRTLSVGTKTLTQGIYRQLPEQPLLGPAADIAGNPWGWVNHHTSDCPQREHLDVVWQSGESLLRCSVARPEDALYDHPAVARYVMALVAEGAFEDLESPLRIYKSNERGRASARVRVDGVLFWTQLPITFMYAWQQGRPDREALQAAAVSHSGSRLAPSAEMEALLPIEAYKASWQALTELPQLFIGR